MSDPIEDFERDCTAAGLAPAAVLREAGLNASTWFRWKSGAVSPTLRSFDAARQALGRMAVGHGAAPAVEDVPTLAVTPGCGAENPAVNISRTGGGA